LKLQRHYRRFRRQKMRHYFQLDLYHHRHLLRVCLFLERNLCHLRSLGLLFQFLL
jgi:hypothetical protein